MRTGTRQGSNPRWSVSLNGAFGAFPFSLSPGGRLRERSSLWPRGATGEQNKKNQGGTGSEIIKRQEVVALWTTDTRQCWCVFCVGACVNVFWGAGIRAASPLPDSLHMSIPVCLGSPASSTNKLKSTAGRFQQGGTGGVRGINEMEVTALEWDCLSLRSSETLKWNRYHNSDVYLAQNTLWCSICSLRSSSSPHFSALGIQTEHRTI